MWTDKLYRRDRRGQEPDQNIEARLFRGLAEHSLGLMCCHDLEGVLLWINPAAAESLGYKTEDAEGRSIDSFLVPRARALFPAYLRRIQRAGFDQGLMRLQSRDGRERVWSYRNIVGADPDLLPHVLGHAIDVTEHVETEQRLREAFRQTPVGHMEIDAQGRLRTINPAACEILGYSEFELLLQGPQSPIQDFCQEMILGGRTSPRLIIFTRRDGRVLHLEVYVRRLGSALEVVSCVLLDVSERVQADTKIRNLNAQLQAKVMASTADLRKSNAELREFAHIASHDLQGPLKQVTRNLGKLAANVTDPEALEYVEKTQGDVQRMSMLVESLLAYALASNENKSPSTQVPLQTALEESLMNLAATITASQAVVLYAGLPELTVNESDFAQLFQNLIANALKYRKPEAPRIEISAEKNESGWVISVKDNGIGIDPKYSERIFEAFRRLHGKEYAGSGMGLAICKKIVDRVGGRIWVESEPGVGSTFRFTIPD